MWEVLIQKVGPGSQLVLGSSHQLGYFESPSWISSVSTMAWTGDVQVLDLGASWAFPSVWLKGRYTQHPLIRPHSQVGHSELHLGVHKVQPGTWDYADYNQTSFSANPRNMVRVAGASWDGLRGTGQLYESWFSLSSTKGSSGLTCHVIHLSLTHQSAPMGTRKPSKSVWQQKYPKVVLLRGRLEDKRGHGPCGLPRNLLI